MSAMNRQAPRTLLFVPGDRAGTLLPKAARAEPDAIVLDLEDAVARDEKAGARREVAAVSWRAEYAGLLLVRTQPVGTYAFEDDVAAALEAGADALILPKVSEPDEVRQADETIEQLVGRGDRPAILPVIETPAGVFAAPEIAEACGRTLGLGLGGEDLRTAIGAPRSASGRELQHARGVVVLAARAARPWAVDSPPLDIDRSRPVLQHALRSRGLGFTGTFVIHPSQVAPVHQAFRPSRTEVEDAERVVEAYQTAQSQGRSVVQVGGRMVDLPVVEAALRILMTEESPPRRPATLED